MSRSRRRSKSNRNSASSSGHTARGSAPSGDGRSEHASRRPTRRSAPSRARPDAQAHNGASKQAESSIWPAGENPYGENDSVDWEPTGSGAEDLGDIVVALLQGTLSSLRDALYEAGFVAAASLVADLADVTDDYLTRYGH